MAGGEAAGGLVLPEEVVAALAGQLAERARCGETVTLTGPGGLLTGARGIWTRPSRSCAPAPTPATGTPSDWAELPVQQGRGEETE
jgi:hypothetical protein